VAKARANAKAQRRTARPAPKAGQARGGDPVQGILAGELKMHDLDDSFGPDAATQLRRAAAERAAGTRLRAVAGTVIRPDEVRKNIENFVGAAQVPVGLAGPLKVEGDHAKGAFFLPLATTEGALVASVNRGCSVVNAAGGARVAILADAMTRGPAFVCRNVQHLVATRAWVQSHLEDIRKAAEGTTSHGRLLGISPYAVGRTLFLRFHFQTGDAMGMNMATLATEAASRVIEKGTGARLAALSGNLCVDKKPASINLTEGRGKSVIAEVLLPHKVVKDRLHTTAEEVADVNTRKNLVGSAKAGALGYNAHFANVLAAMFIATGQDAAQVVDGSLGFTTAEADRDGLYFAVSLPALEVGTVGGGTRFPTQQECLQLMGCAGPGKSRKLAEIVASAVLAGELSLLGAIAAGHLGRAHARLGR
jgi:hydroxymethylglutaryl-CoA reductase (NADPH)